MALQDGLIRIGQDVGPYRIEALIGAGGMGMVYRARDRQLERTVAIKVVNQRQAKADSERCLLQEARLAAALDHPSVCSIHEVGSFGDQSFIVMEHVEGTLLTALIPTGQGLAGGNRAALRDPDRGCGRARAQARHRAPRSQELEHHDHRRRPGEIARLRARVPIADADTSELNTTFSLETLSDAGSVYMAPELLRGRPADRRSDVWALGVLLYQMAGAGVLCRRHALRVGGGDLADPVAPLPREVAAPVRQSPPAA